MTTACCEPTPCCSCHHPVSGRTRRDVCMCGCGYLNGGLQVAGVQFLLLLGAFFSAAALGDCGFMRIEPGLDPPGLFEFTLPIDRLGFITFERPTGNCYWYEDGHDQNRQIQRYFDMLGSDWQMSRIFSAMAAAGGWLYFLYSISFCCSAQIRAVRYFNACLLCFILTLFQGLPFLIFNSDFCDEYVCEFDRSAGWGVGAASCYFLSGLCFALMTDYPGRPLHKDSQETNADAGDDPTPPSDPEDNNIAGVVPVPPPSDSQNTNADPGADPVPSGPPSQHLEQLQSADEPPIASNESELYYDEEIPTTGSSGAIAALGAGSGRPADVSVESNLDVASDAALPGSIHHGSGTFAPVPPSNPEATAPTIVAETGVLVPPTEELAPNKSLGSRSKPFDEESTINPSIGEKWK